MSALFFLLELLPNLAEACLYGYIISRCLDFRYSRNKLCLLVLSWFFLISTSTFLITVTVLRTLLLYIADIVCAVLCTRNSSIIRRLFFGSILSFLTFLSEKIVIFLSALLVMYPISDVDTPSFSRYCLILCYILLLTGLSILVVHLQAHPLMFSKPFLACYLSGIMMMACISELLLDAINALEAAPVSFDTFYLRMAGLGFLFVVIILFFLVLYAGKLYEEKLKLTEQKQQALSEQKALHSLMRTNDLLQGWKHDLSNHLNTLAQLVHAGEYAHMEQYLQEMSASIQYAEPVRYTGHPTIDTVLSLKFSEMRQKGIDVRHEIFWNKSYGLPLNDTELSSILSNALDNAMDSCDHVPEAPFIHFQFKQYHSQLFIQISNSNGRSYHYDRNGHFLSSKTMDGHGLGLKRIRNLTDSAGGFCQVSADPDKFILRIMLPCLEKSICQEEPT